MISPSLTRLRHRPDKPDDRDVRFHPETRALPATATLARYCPPVYDQGAIQSCSAHAVSAAIRVTAAIENVPVDPPSRLFVYYNARVLNGDPGVDDGATIRDALKAAAKPGICAETQWPYLESRVLDRPVAEAYAAATAGVREYQRIDPDLDALRACIAGGSPFIFGINVYNSTVAQWMHGGNLLPPQSNEAVLGGHAILAVGYDDGTRVVRALNSCGAATGDNGFVNVPYSYFQRTDQTYDFWTIRKIG